MSELDRQIISSYNSSIIDYLDLNSGLYDTFITGDMAIFLHLENADMLYKNQVFIVECFVFQNDISTESKIIKFLKQISEEIQRHITNNYSLKNKNLYFKELLHDKKFFESIIQQNTLIIKIYGVIVAIIKYRNIKETEYFIYGPDELKIVNLCFLIRDQLEKLSQKGKINKLIDDTSKLFADAIVNNRMIEDKYKKLYVLFRAYFDINKEKFPSFIQGSSSCVVEQVFVENPALISNFAQIKNDDTDEYCESKTLLGVRHKTYDSFAKLSKRLKDYYSDIDKIFSGASNSIYEWSRYSKEITHTLENYYISRKFGLGVNINEKLKSEINNLQKACLAKPIGENITVYKTGRTFIYDNGKISSEFKEGDRIYQHIFHSTTIDQGLQTLINFSAYQTGVCAYVINIPAGFPCVYAAEYSDYPEESEILLPVGTIFQIDKVHTDTYLFSFEKYHKIITYEVSVDASFIPERLEFSSDYEPITDFNSLYIITNDANEEISV